MNQPWRGNTTENISSQDDPRYETPGGAQNKVDTAFNNFKNEVELPIRSESIVERHYRSESVSSRALAQKAVTRSKIATGAVGSQELDPSLLEQYADIAINAKFEEIDAKLKDVAINLKMLGAKGDGIQDDNPYFKEVLESNVIQNIFVPEGTYLIRPSTAIRVKGNKRITFNTGAKVIVDPNMGKWDAWLRPDLTENTLENIIFDGMNFDGNIENNTGGQTVDGTDNRQYFMHFLLNDVPTSNIRIINSHIKSSGRNVVIINGRQAKDCYINGNTFEYRLKQTSSWEDNTVLFMNTRNHIVLDNIFYMKEDIGQTGECAIETHWGEGIVSNNIMRGFILGCNITSRSPTNPADGKSKAIRFSNNTIECRNGVTLWSFAPDQLPLWVLEDVVVSHNTIRCENIGVQLRFDSGYVANVRGKYKNIEINNNNIIYPSDAVYTDGSAVGNLNGAIVFGALADVEDCVIDSNIISNHPYGGIAIISQGFIRKNIVITNNTFFNPCTGANNVSVLDKKSCVFFDGASEVFVDGNKIFNQNHNLGYAYRCPNAFSGNFIFVDNMVPNDLAAQLRTQTSPANVVRNKYNPNYMPSTFASTSGNISGYFENGDMVQVGTNLTYVCNVRGAVGGVFSTMSGTVTKAVDGTITYSNCGPFLIGMSVKIVEKGTVTTCVGNYNGDRILASSITGALTTGTFTLIPNPPSWSISSQGTATIPASSTTVSVPHGMGVTPSVVLVTPKGNLGNVWVGSIGSTTFTINCSTANGSNIMVSWEAKS